MNKANILKVANDVDYSSTFNMNAYTTANDCVSPGCIAGHAYCLASEAICKDRDDHDYEGIALKYMGIPLDDHRAKSLLYPGRAYWGCGEYDYQSRYGDRGHITREHAATCLRHLAETGKVDWVATAACRIPLGSS